MKGKEKRAALLAVLLMLVPVWAMAEGERGTRDITFAVIVFGTALMAGMVYLWRRQILPFLEQHALVEEARLIVNCVEAAFGRGQGKEKWEAAMAKMAEHGWNIDREEVLSEMKEAEGVEEIHHVHIWAISTTQTALTAHIVVAPGFEPENVVAEVKHHLRHAGIQHATIETERHGFSCGDHDCC